MATETLTKSTSERLVACLEHIAADNAELTKAVANVLDIQQGITRDLRETNAQMMSATMKLFEQLHAARSRPAFVLSVDPVLGVDLHFSKDLLTQISKDLEPGLKRFAQQMEGLLRQRAVATTKKKPIASARSSKSNKAKK